MARRAKKKKAADEAEIPMSSMIDVVFLLLIYFIVTQKPVVEDTLLGVNLPAPNPPQQTEPQEPPKLFSIDVIKTANSKYYTVNDMPTPLETMKEQLQTVADNDPETTIIIKCGPNAKHDKLVKVLDACAEVGLARLNLVELPLAFEGN